MKTVERLTSILSLAPGYRLFGQLIRGRATEIYVSNYVKPKSGDRLLDIGCGPGDILNYLPSVDYTGFDISPEYIAAAEKRFGSRGRFFCGDVGATSQPEEGGYDIALATGVVHHLDDEVAGRLFKLAMRALRPEGRLITFDGCYESGQSSFARWMLDHDRGKFVRTQAEYRELASATFSRVEESVRNDLLRVPYTHLILSCRK